MRTLNLRKSVGKNYSSMVRSLIVYMGLTLFSLTSCMNEELLDIPSAEEQNRALVISMDGIRSRATDPGHAIAKDSIGVVTKLHIYVTGEDGTIYAYKDISEEEEWRELATNGKSYTFSDLDSKARRVIILGNSAGSIQKEGSLYNFSSKLLWEEQQEVGKLLYIGQSDLWTPIGKEEYEGKMRILYKTTVNLKPLVARFQINTVNFYFEKQNGQRYEPVLAGVYMNRFYASIQPVDILKLDYKASDLKKNITSIDRIKEGRWFFDNEDYAGFASYNKWNGSRYEAMKSSENHPDPFLRLYKNSDECYAFYFFPGQEYPTLHFHVEIEEDGIYCDWNKQGEVTLRKGYYLANLVKFARLDGTLLEPKDFVPGKLYNLDIIIHPALLADDITDNNVSSLDVTVEVSEWDWEDLYPGGFVE